MRIGIFCSANNEIETIFFEQAQQLGKLLAENGHEIVYGGCNTGLMECVGKAAFQAGGNTIGVVPRIIEENSRTSDYVRVNIMCENLSDRKDLILAKSDVLIALPGGIGTLDEIFTVAASATIGYHRKKVILLNINDFWKPLVNLLDSLQANSMIRGNWQQYIMVANNLDELTDHLKNLP